MAYSDEQHLRNEGLEIMRRTVDVALLCASHEKLRQIGEFVSPNLSRVVAVHSDGRFRIVFPSHEWHQMCVFAWRSEPDLLWISDLDERKFTRALCNDVRGIVRASMPFGKCDFRVMRTYSSQPLPIVKSKPLASVVHTPSPRIPHSSPPRTSEAPFSKSLKEGRVVEAVKQVAQTLPPPPLEYSEVLPLLQFLPLLRADGFSPFEDLWDGITYRRVRSPALFAFCLELSCSTILHPLDTFEHRFSLSYNRQQFVARQHPQRAWRERLSFLYWGQHLVYPNDAAMKEVVAILEDMENVFDHDSRAYPSPSLASWNLSMDRETQQEALWEGNTKNIGYMARDGGQIGSFPLADDYSDEGDAMNNDNEWYDKH